MDNRKQIGTLVLKTAAGDTCANCKFRKELYKNKPTECDECGFSKYRSDSYKTNVPVYQEEGE